jgi:hypothetical protein
VAGGFGEVERRVTREGDLVRLTVELDQAGSIEGVITDDVGDPVENAEVIVTDSTGTELARARSGAGGRFRVDGIPEGDVRVTADPPDALSANLAAVSEETDVRRGLVTRDVQLRLERR